MNGHLVVDSEGASAAVRAARVLMRLLSPPGPRARLSILIYHRVHAAPDPLFPGEVDATRFDAHLALLREMCNVLPLDDAIARLARGALPRSAACITFDDGYADNADVALPLLQRHGLPATFFVSTGFLDGGRMWNDTIIETIRLAEGDAIDLTRVGLARHSLATPGERRRAIERLIDAHKYLPPAERLARVEAIRDLAGVRPPDGLMMSRDAVRRLAAAGMGVGAHTVTHPILARLPIDAARREIADGRAELEAITGAKVDLFAYPNGKPDVDYTADHVRLARTLGFTAAVSTSWGAARARSDLHQLPRFTPWDRTPGRFALRLVRNLRSRPVQLAA